MYCLLPDVVHARWLIHELRENGLSDRYIHVLAREDVPIDGMHKATIVQRTELVRGIKRGAFLGGIAGLLGGVLAITVPPAGIDAIGNLFPLLTTFAGAGFGVGVCALLDCGSTNHELRPFRTPIIMGQILVILDVPAHNIALTGRMIERLDRHAKVGLVED
jgi:hypothetical protein